MIFCKIGIAAAMAAGVIAAMAAWDGWRNRRKYAARERRRKAQGGLD